MKSTADIRNKYGILINFAEALDLMDKEVREELNIEISYCTEQEYFDAYTEAHQQKYSKDWEIAERNHTQQKNREDEENIMMYFIDTDTSKVRNEYGVLIAYDGAVGLMDDDIREALNYEMAPCTAQEFFDAYAAAHQQKYGEEWELAKHNPVW